MSKQYHDVIQGRIEADLQKAFGGNPALMATIDSEQIVGATMLWQNIFYAEARERVKQALTALHRRKSCVTAI